MSLLSESQIKSYRNSTRNFSMTLNESLKEFKNQGTNNRVKVFLSHKHDELEILDGAIGFLKKEGVDIYVDWLDEGMPKTTSGKTASRIKVKIKENDKFIFLATEGAINSKWCNWELGFGDAEKYIQDKIAILPVEKDLSYFTGSEYLDIYPYVEYRDGTTKYNSGLTIPRGYYVLYPTVNDSKTIVKLSDWLTR